MSGLDANVVVRASPRVTFRKLAEGSGGVLLNLDTAAYHGVNEMGSAIWSLVEAAPTFGELVERLRPLIDDPPSSLADDVAAFLIDLDGRNLLILEGRTD